MPPSSFYKANITVIAKKDRIKTQKRKLQANIYGEYRWKHPQQDINKTNTTIH